ELAATRVAGLEPGPPGRCALGIVEFHLDAANWLQPAWPGWSPALPGGVSLGASRSISTQRAGCNRVAGMEPGPPGRGVFGSVEFHLDAANWLQPAWPGWNPAFRG